MGRFVLSKTSDWELVHDNQDIRGWPVQDATGTEVGHVDKLVADTDSELVETIVLDNGREYPARDIELGDRVVYLEGVPASVSAAGPVGTTYSDVRIGRREAVVATGNGYAAYEDAFRQHYGTAFANSGKPYDYYEPAYRWGFTYGTDPAYSGRDYAALETEMRRGYEEKHGAGTWERVKDAVRHAFDHSRRRR